MTTHIVPFDHHADPFFFARDNPVCMEAESFAIVDRLESVDGIIESLPCLVNEQGYLRPKETLNKSYRIRYN